MGLILLDRSRGGDRVSEKNACSTECIDRVRGTRTLCLFAPFLRSIFDFRDRPCTFTNEPLYPRKVVKRKKACFKGSSTLNDVHARIMPTWKRKSFPDCYEVNAWRRKYLLPLKTAREILFLNGMRARVYFVSCVISSFSFRVALRSKLLKIRFDRLLHEAIPFRTFASIIFNSLPPPIARFF